jgi:hypothetical protein
VPKVSCWSRSVRAQGSCNKSILMVRPALFYVMLHRCGPNLAVFGPRPAKIGHLARSKRLANPHKLSQPKTELVGEGKYDEYGNRRELTID